MNIRIREYETIHAEVRAAVSAAPDASRDRRMQIVADALWNGLHDEGLSWVGFYVADPDRTESERLVLGPCRDKPACSPIGLHGVCGKAFRTGAIQIVRDVAELGAEYIACDPRDRSEIVFPLFECEAAVHPPDSPLARQRRAACWGVLDADSHEVGAFDEADVAGLTLVLEAAGFHAA